MRIRFSREEVVVMVLDLILRDPHIKTPIYSNGDSERCY